MANVYRIFVEKKKGNDIEAMQILTDLRQNVGITALTGLRLINRYDVQGVSEAEFRRAVHGVFAEDNLDNTADDRRFRKNFAEIHSAEKQRKRGGSHAAGKYGPSPL